MAETSRRRHREPFQRTESPCAEPSELREDSPAIFRSLGDLEDERHGPFRRFLIPLLLFSIIPPIRILCDLSVLFLPLHVASPIFRACAQIAINQTSDDICSSIIYQFILIRYCENSVAAPYPLFFEIIQKIIIRGALFAIIFWATGTESGNNIGLTHAVANYFILFGCGRAFYRVIYRHGGSIQLISTLLEFIAPSGEKTLKDGKIRLMWSCICGKSFYHDADERIFINSSSFRKAAFPLSTIAESPNTPSTSDSQHIAVSKYPVASKDTIPTGTARRSGLYPSSSSRGYSIGVTTGVVQESGIHETKPSGRWLLACFPTKQVVWHLDVNNGEKDRDAFDEIKRRYCIERKALRRFFEMKSVSRVLPVQMYLRSDTTSSKLSSPPIASIYSHWSWIDVRDVKEEWEFEDPEFPIEILEQIATELWKGAGHGVASFPDQQLADQHQSHSEDSLPRHRGDPLGARDYNSTFGGWLRSMVRRRKSNTLRNQEGLEYRGIYENWLKAFKHKGGLGGDFWRSKPKPHPKPPKPDRWSIGDDGGGPEHDIFIRKIPKKLNIQLTPASQPMPRGWGVLIEESFAIHWSFIAFVYALPGGFAVFSLVWTFKHGFTLWTIAGWILTICTGFANLVMAKKQTKLL